MQVRFVAKKTTDFMHPYYRSRTQHVYLNIISHLWRSKISFTMFPKLAFRTWNNTRIKIKFRITFQDEQQLAVTLKKMQINICLSSFKMLNYVDVIQWCTEMTGYSTLVKFHKHFLCCLFQTKFIRSMYNILQVYNVVGNYLTSKVKIHNNIMYAYLEEKYENSITRSIKYALSICVIRLLKIYFKRRNWLLYKRLLYTRTAEISGLIKIRAPVTGTQWWGHLAALHRNLTQRSKA